MHRLSLILVTSAVLAVLTPTAGAFAVDEPAAPAADPSAQTVLHDIADALADQPAAPVATDDQGDATGERLATDLPASGSQSAETTSPAGTLTMDIPATGTDLAPASDTTALFDGTGSDTTLAVQETTDGLRALVHLESADAPERFDFPIGGDVVSLQPVGDGAVEAVGTAGEVIATASAPWATDANGVAVPTHYEIHGTVLTQIVDHRSGAYGYPSSRTHHSSGVGPASSCTGVVRRPSIWRASR